MPIDPAAPARSRIVARIETMRRELDRIAEEMSRVDEVETGELDRDALYDAAVQALAQRRGMAALFDEKVFIDPATNILLSVYVMEHDGQEITTGACCAKAGVPRTTALRYVGVLGSLGHLVAETNECDRRKTIVNLSPSARSTLETWLAGVAQRS